MGDQHDGSITAPIGGGGGGGRTIVVHSGLIQEHMWIWETAHDRSVAKQVTSSQEHRNPANSLIPGLHLLLY